MSISNHNMIPFNPLMKVDDDGQYIPEARAWSPEKYKLVGSYCDIFTTGMKWLEAGLGSFRTSS